MRSSPGFLAVNVFIDGGYVRSNLERLGVTWSNLNLRDVAAVAMTLTGHNKQWLGRDFGIARTLIYDAAEEGATTNAVGQWLERHDREAEVQVRRGTVAGGHARSKRQKGVDVQLAVDALQQAQRGTFDVALLLSGDGDFVPVIEAVRESGHLACVCGFESTMASELRRVADRVNFLSEDPAAWQGWMTLPALPAHLQSS